MKRPVLVATVLSALATSTLTYWLIDREVTASARSSDPAAAVASEQPEQGLVALGQHLVSTAGCHDCHTPFKMGENGAEPDMTRMLSGHPEALVMPPPPPASPPWLIAAAGTNTAWSGPWGVSFTANLTPDPETGIGNWTKETFIQTIRTGRHMGRGRPILPPMPIPVYRNFSDEELGAIFSYLRTIPPLKNRVPEPRPPQESAGAM